MAGDIDGDGDIDAVRVSGASLTVVTNDGSCRFTEGATYSLPSTVQDIELADIDGDGIADLVVGVSGVGTGLVVLHGAGGATFSPPTIVPVSGAVVGLAIGDANGDSLPDVALAYLDPPSLQYRLLWMHGEPTRSYALGQWVSAAFVNAITTLDHDGDGDDDIVFVDDLIGGDVVMAETVAGQTSAPFVTMSSSNAYGIALLPCDIDGDGDEDLVFGNLIANVTLTLGSLRNLGGGAWAAGPTQTLSGTAFSSLFAGDWDGDGDQDLCLRQGHSSGFPGRHYTSLFSNDGTGVFSRSWDHVIFGQADYVGGVGIFDLNGDGHADFLDDIAAFCGDGTLEDPLPRRSGARRPIDWDGDGDLDAPGFLGSVWINDGTGALTETTWNVPDVAPQRYLGEIGYADLDGNGLMDTIAPLFDPPPLFGPFVFREMRRLEDDGDGGFVDLGPAAAPGLQITGPVLADDVDGDGDVDLVNDEGLWLASAGVTFAFGGQPFAGWVPVAMADVDGDGDRDFLARPTGGHGAAILRRIGPASYAVEVLAPAKDGDDDGVEVGLESRAFDGFAAGWRRQYGTGGAGAGGRRPVLGAVGPIRPGLVPELRLAQAVGGAFAILAVAGAESNLQSTLVPGLTLYAYPELFSIGYVLPGPLGRPGAGELDIALAIPPGLGGVRLYFQVLVFDPAAGSQLAHSNGLELVVGQ